MHQRITVPDAVPRALGPPAAPADAEPTPTSEMKARGCAGLVLVVSASICSGSAPVPRQGLRAADQRTSKMRGACRRPAPGSRAACGAVGMGGPLQCQLVQV